MCVTIAESLCLINNEKMSPDEPPLTTTKITITITIISPAEPPPFTDSSAHQLPTETQVEIQSHKKS